MSTSTPSPKGSRASPVTPTMYRLVVVLALIFCARATSRKSVKGMPPLTPKENGWEHAAAAERNNRHSGFMMLVTGTGVPWFPLSHAQGEGFPQVHPPHFGVARQRFR